MRTALHATHLARISSVDTVMSALREVRDRCQVGFELFDAQILPQQRSRCCVCVAVHLASSDSQHNCKHLL